MLQPIIRPTLEPPFKVYTFSRSNSALFIFTFFFHGASFQRKESASTAAKSRSHFWKGLNIHRNKLKVTKVVFLCRNVGKTWRWTHTHVGSNKVFFFFFFFQRKNSHYLNSSSGSRIKKHRFSLKTNIIISERLSLASTRMTVKN